MLCARCRRPVPRYEPSSPPVCRGSPSPFGLEFRLLEPPWSPRLGTAVGRRLDPAAGGGHFTFTARGRAAFDDPEMWVLGQHMSMNPIVDQVVGEDGRPIGTHMRGLVLLERQFER